MADKEQSKKEINAIIIASLVLGFVFGFDDKSSVFIPSYWVQNYVQQAILSLLFILLSIRITKAYAEKQGITTTFSIWRLKRIGLSAKAVLKGNGFPLGIFLPLFITVLSFGKIFFASIISPTFSYTTTSRFGKKIVNPREAEIATISLVGPLSLTLLGIFLSSLNGTGLNNLSMIPFTIAISSMIPFGTLNGMNILIGSPVRYVLAVIFILATFLLTFVTGPLASIILGLIASALLTATHYIYSYVFK